MQAPEERYALKPTYIKWAFFALPTFLLIYTFPAVITSANLPLFVFLAAIPVINKNMKPGNKVMLYLLSEMILMILIIVATVSLYELSISGGNGATSTYESIASAMPVLPIVMTAEGVFPFIFIMEGLRKSKLSDITYTNIIATGTLLNELAVMHFARIRGTSFLGAFAYTQSLQGSSVISLLTYGTQTGMPLQLFVPSIWPVMLPLFVLSFLAFFAYIYTEEKGGRTINQEAFWRRIAIGVSVAVCIMIAAISASFAGLQFFLISSAVFVTTAAVIITDEEVRGTIFRRRKSTRR